MTPLKRVVVGAALLVLVAAAGVLFGAVRSTSPVAPALPSEEFEADLFRRAAEAAKHRRVLLVRAEPGKEAVARILASSGTGSGWTLYPVAPPSAGWMSQAFDRLADAAARDYLADRLLDPDTRKALERFDVKLIVVHDGRRQVPLKAPARDPHLAERGSGPFLDLRHAEFVWQILAEKPSEAATPEIAFAKGLVLGDANMSDPELGLWSSSVTIEAFDDAEYLFSLPADGARVTVDGAPVTPRKASLPFAIVPVPKGSHRVEVSFGQDRGRDAFLIGAATAVVAALIALLLALRPTPRLPEPPEQEATSASPGGD